MLNINTLFNNKTIFNPDSKMMEKKYGIWDLTRSSISYNKVDIRIKKYVLVTDDEAMRGDLITNRLFANEKYVGSIMKFNSISNPFSINSGDFLLIPTKGTFDNAEETKTAIVEKGNTTLNPNQKFREAQEQKKFKVSDSRKKFLEDRLKAKNAPAQVLPPNFMQEGERQTIRTNAVIGLAPDVTNATPDPNASL